MVASELFLHAALSFLLLLFSIIVRVKSQSQFCAALSSSTVHLQGLTIKGDQLIVISNNMGMELPLSSVDSSRGTLSLSRSRELGKLSDINWLSGVASATEPILAVNVLGDGHVGVMFKSLKHRLLDVNTGQNVKMSGEILGKYGIISDGKLDGSSYVLRTNSYRKDPESERTVAWVPRVVLTIKGRSILRLPTSDQEEAPFPHFFVSRASGAKELTFTYSPWRTNPQYGDRHVPGREQLPVFGFIHNGVIHLAIQSTQQVMLFDDPKDALYMPQTTQGRHFVKVPVTVTPFNRYFDCSGVQEQLNVANNSNEVNNGAQSLKDEKRSFPWALVITLATLLALVGLAIGGFLYWKKHYAEQSMKNVVINAETDTSADDSASDSGKTLEMAPKIQPVSSMDSTTQKAHKQGKRSKKNSRSRSQSRRLSKREGRKTKARSRSIQV